VRTHLDGARIFNAAAALNRPARELAEGFDSVMFCLSKGLGAPVGSLLCGAADLMGEARVVRKRMGGGMRQAGVLAAAGQIALTRNVARLVEDHRRAAELGRALANSRLFDLDPTVVQTNIVIARVLPPHDSQGVLRRLADGGVLAGAMGSGRIRFVTHLDVDDEGLSRAIAVIRALDEV
jgi:threonine aldolase